MALPLPYFASAPSFIGACPADAAAEEKETLSDASSLIVSLLLRYKHCSQGQLIHHAKVGPTSLNHLLFTPVSIKCIHTCMLPGETIMDLPLPVGATWSILEMQDEPDWLNHSRLFYIDCPRYYIGWVVSASALIDVCCHDNLLLYILMVF